jgi:hypothetical protein
MFSALVNGTKTAYSIGLYWDFVACTGTPIGSIEIANLNKIYLLK